ncbi:MAG: type II toxin-antitoxin system RatA family toxin [Planctomycetota bacterium]
MSFVGVVEFVRAEPAAVYALFRNPETFPEFMTNVQRVEVLQRGDGWSISHWLTDLDGAPLEWQEVDHYDDEAHVIAFQLIEGDITRFEGKWAFAPCTGGTAASCEIEYELGVPLIEEAVGPIIRQKLESNIEEMLAAAKERVETTQAAPAGG